MTPTYWRYFIENPNTLLGHVMQLSWLNMTETRLEYFMSEVPRSYAYGKGRGEREYTSSPFTKEVLDVMDKLNNPPSEAPLGYNFCFLNRYNDQRNHLGWHADDFQNMDGSHPIAVVSLGAEREIWWRLKTDKGKVPPENRQLLEHGSLFVMPGGFQDDHYHKIPKCDHECGTRVSLTFRRYLAAT